jgi:hypothetical protein
VVTNGIQLCPSLVFNVPGAGGFGIGVSGAGAACISGKNARQLSISNKALNVFVSFFILVLMGCRDYDDFTTLVE